MPPSGDLAQSSLPKQPFEKGPVVDFLTGPSNKSNALGPDGVLALLLPPQPIRHGQAAAEVSRQIFAVAIECTGQVEFLKPEVHEGFAAISQREFLLKDGSGKSKLVHLGPTELLASRTGPSRRKLDDCKCSGPGGVAGQPLCSGNEFLFPQWFSLRAVGVPNRIEECHHCWPRFIAVRRCDSVRPLLLPS
ncbi:hypothetical protein AOC05_09710 [Arthrobacter alpinus]|uniref:Uncharacterized protein n=1 Tax=Arthrobacter alpinus TaxID=656366 RepID=A0A0M4QMU7_9MICC|nr:hypothetical protein AOC05_09710 [Arthrobacter alpinus]